MIKTGIIGISGFGNIHMQELFKAQEAGLTEISGALVRTPSKVMESVERLEKLGAAISPDPDAFFRDLKGKMDLCIISTGIDTHCPLTVRALEAGAHVLVEKPVAATLGEVAKMEEAAARAGRKVAVGFQQLFASENWELKKELLSGAIGRIRRIRGLGMWNRPVSYFNRSNWAGALKVGDSWVLDSPVNNALAHYFHLMLFLCGPTLGETAHLETLEGESYRVQPITNFDTCCLRAQTREGIIMEYFATHSCSKHHQPRIRIEGDEGTVEWMVNDYMALGSCRLIRKDGTEKVFELPAHQDLHQNVITGTLRWIGGDDATPVCDLASGRAHVEAINALLASMPEPVEPGPEFIRSLDLNGKDVQVILEGIEDVFGECFESGKLFSEGGYPWAKSGKKVVLSEMPPLR